MTFEGKERTPQNWLKAKRAAAIKEVLNETMFAAGMLVSFQRLVKGLLYNPGEIPFDGYWVHM